MDYIINALSWTMIILVLIRGFVKAFLPNLEDRHWFYKIEKVTDPVIVPLKGIIPSFGKLDLSYLVGIIMIRLLSIILMWLF